MMNLGQKEARDVKVRLRNPADKGGDVWAEGKVNIPARSIAIAVLPVLEGHTWKVWTGAWKMEVEAPGSEVFVY